MVCEKWLLKSPKNARFFQCFFLCCASITGNGHCPPSASNPMNFELTLEILSSPKWNNYNKENLSPVYFLVLEANSESDGMERNLQLILLLQFRFLMIRDQSPSYTRAREVLLKEKAQYS